MICSHLFVCLSVSPSVSGMSVRSSIHLGVTSVCLSVCTCLIGQMGAGSNATITEEMYRASLQSAVEDKIRRRLREVFDQAQVTGLM